MSNSKIISTVHSRNYFTGDGATPFFIDASERNRNLEAGVLETLFCL